MDVLDKEAQLYFGRDPEAKRMGDEVMSCYYFTKFESDSASKLFSSLGGETLLYNLDLLSANLTLGSLARLSL